ncbi:MAG: hypothetical protein WCH11_01570 [Bdellovibrio sp.]
MNRALGFARLVGLFVALASCAKRESTSDLKVSFTASETFVIDANATSCSAVHDYLVAVASCNKSGASCTSAPVLSTGGVSGPYANIGNMKMEWGRSETLVVIYVKFTLRSSSLSGGKYEYTLSDKPLWVMWRRGASWDPPSNPRLPNEGDTSSNGVTNSTLSMCEMQIPSIGVANRNLSASFSGSALVYGYYRDQESRQIPIFATSEGFLTKWLGSPP